MAETTETEAARSPRFITLLFFVKVQLPYRDQAPPLRQRGKNPRPCTVINLHNRNSRSIGTWLFVTQKVPITLTHLQSLSNKHATIKTSGPDTKPWGTPRSGIIVSMIMLITNSGLMQLIVFISLLSSCFFGCCGRLVPL